MKTPICKTILVAVIGLLLGGTSFAQRQMERLGRGVIAMKNSSTQVYVGWRLLGNDPTDIAFNLYRSANGAAAVKVNGSPLTATTDYVDTPANLNSTAYSYSVKAVVGGVEVTDTWANPLSGPATLPANAPTRQYIPVPIQPTPDDAAAGVSYGVKFCWVGDFDGDGEYDFLIDRTNSNVEAKQWLQAYKRDGTLLWQMDMGPNSVNHYNITPGSSSIGIGHGDNVTVYDLDGDGKAEVIVRTANGVVFANGMTLAAPDNEVQYISILDGMTGLEKIQTSGPNVGTPARAIVPIPASWVTKTHVQGQMGIVYADGIKPSVFFHPSNRNADQSFNKFAVTWDYRNGALTQRWVWLPSGHTAEGHQIRFADVDNDGKDEYCDVGNVVKSDGSGQINENVLTDVVHGDRFHIADIDPDRPRLETFLIQQNNGTGLATVYSAADKSAVIQKGYAGGVVDVGRGTIGAFVPNLQGLQFFSTQPGTFDCKGNQIYANQPFPPETIWWDGDLGREFLSTIGSTATSPGIDKFNTADGSTGRVLSLYSDPNAPNSPYNNYIAYGGRPQFWGDILGDWREEMICVASDNSELRIYTTKTPDAAKTGGGVPFRIYTLMQNPQYRIQATTKGYVQSSYVDYYLGYNMTPPPPPPMVDAKLVWRGGAGTTTWNSGTTPSWLNSGANATFANGDSVRFDISGDSTTTVVLTGSLQPSAVTVYSPKNNTFDGSGGSLAGSMTLMKSGAGVMTLSGTHAFTGKTTVWDGALLVNGNLQQSPVTVWGGTWGGALAAGATGGRIGGTGTFSQPVAVKYRGAITPGAGMGSAGTVTFGAGLTAEDGATFALDLLNDPTGVTTPSDRIAVTGNLVISGKVAIVVKPLNSQLAAGTYTLVTYSGTLTGSLSNLAVTVPAGTPYSLAAGSGVITLTVPVTRSAASVTWRGTGGAWDLATSQNWLLAAAADLFVSGDSVTFDSTGAASPTVTLGTALPVGGVIVNAATDYTFTGAGSISGTGGLTKSGTGTLTISTSNDYTGATTVSGGVLAVSQLNDAGSPSSIGAASAAASNLVINGGVLRLAGSQSNSNRSLTIGASGGTLDIPTANVSMQLSGSITGTGKLTKTGAGTLILASANSYSGGTLVQGGTIYLAGSTPNSSGMGSGSLTLENGTVSMSDVQASETAAWNVFVPAGGIGRLNADGRCTLSGTLTGSGDFTFYTPYVRTELTGSWAAFTGRIYVVSDADGGDFRIKNTAGYPTAQLDLGDQVYAYYNNTGISLTLPVGALSGVSTSVLMGGLSAGATITWQVGARNQDSTFAGVIVNNTGPSALTKVGTGKLTLSGANTYTGTTSVSAGRLQINGSSGASNFTVQNGATLGGSGTITGNVTVLTGGALEHGTLSATALTITGNLTLPSSVVVRPATGATTAGTYTVLTYSGTLTGTPTFSWEAPAGSSLTATFATSTAGVVTMTLTAPSRIPGPITWTGSTNFNWDAATSNWLAAGLPVSYQPGDSPSFTDSGNATSAINLVAEVLPAAVTVNSIQNYTFSGTGQIGGTATFAKSGSGILTITGVHSTSGAIAISGGVLSVTQTGSGTGGVGAVVGTGPITLSGGGEFRMGSANGKNFPGNAIAVSPGSSGVFSSVTLSNGSGSLLTGAADSVLTISGPFSFTGSGVSQFTGFDGTLIVPSGSQLRFSSTSGPNGNGGTNTTFQINGLINTRNAGGANGVVLGALTGSGSIQGQSNTTAGTVVYHIGAKNLDTTFSGIIANGANGTAAINKLGTGTLALSRASTYTGTTTVTAGKLSVTGSLAATPVTVATTGVLGGTGTIGGAVTCNGTLAPGASIGTLTLSAGLTLASTSTLVYELSTTSDLAAVTGNLTLDGTVNVAAAAGFAAGSYTLVTYTGTLTNNILNLGTLPAGYAATVNIATAGQVRLVVTALNSAPQISVAAGASPSNVTGTTTSLAITATDDAGEGNLTYTWSATGPAAMSFSPNGTNAAKNATATFSAPGSYTLSVTARDVPGLTAVSSISVTVVATPASLTVNPPSATLEVGGAQTLAASALDQFGGVVATPSIVWSASGGGTISQDGLYTATAAGGPWQATATSGGIGASAAITVSSRTFETWMTTMFTQSQIAAGDAALDADPDHDGLTNLAEYALGGQPYAFTAQPQLASDPTSISITFQRPAWIGDVTYHVEVGGGLTSWSGLTLEVLNPGTDPESVRATYTLPVPKPAQSFLRLRFEK